MTKREKIFKLYEEVPEFITNKITDATNHEDLSNY
jgi:hypothetical protein